MHVRVTSCVLTCHSDTSTRCIVGSVSLGPSSPRGGSAYGQRILVGGATSRIGGSDQGMRSNLPDGGTVALGFAMRRWPRHTPTSTVVHVCQRILFLDRLKIDSANLR